MGQEFSIVEKLARDLGFSDCGVASLKQGNAAAERYQQWLKKSYHGEMHYLESGFEKRKNPGLILNDARSLICLAWDYASRVEPGMAPSPYISRYAWAADYHLFLQQKLKLFEEKLREYFPQSQFKSYVDTGPIQEKHWALLSGLGWMGKHTNLIHPQRGSYFFLASILTDLDFSSEKEIIKDHCGKCEACISICPTQAIVAPYVLDARLCISYLTIELKGPIPRHLRSAIGTHVFGCDDCQEVCPWNRHSKLPLEFLRSASLEELHDYLGLDVTSFKAYFKDTPLLRSKRRGFLRNVCVVLGNIKDPKSLPFLEKALQEDEVLIRGHAAWALGQYPLAFVQERLEKTLQKEGDLWVKEELIQALNGV